MRIGEIRFEVREKLGAVFVSVFVFLSLDALLDEHVLETEYPDCFVVAHGIVANLFYAIVGACGL